MSIIYFFRTKITKYKNSKRNVVISKTSKIRPKVYLNYVKVGKFSDINFNTSINNTTLGNYCNISFNVIIGPRSHLFNNFTTHDIFYKNQEHHYDKYINEKEKFEINKIGNDVWIGCNSIIMQGVNIGNGAIIAAGSVVTKSIPPYAIVGGNPAKFIKWRFPKDIIDKLEDTKWFEKDNFEVNKVNMEKIVEFDLIKSINSQIKNKGVLNCEKKNKS